MGDADYLYVFHNIVMPIAMEFSPELVLGEVVSQLECTHSLMPLQCLRASMPQMGMTWENVTLRLLDMLT